MRRARLLQSLTIAIALAALPSGVQILNSQERPGSATRIDSLTEQGEGLTVSARSAITGQVMFASSQRGGILLAVAPAASAVERGLAFVDLYGSAFGLTNRSQVQLQRAPVADQLGFEHVRFQQVHRGVPVTAAQLLVHLKGARVLAANGHMVTDLPDAVVPAVSPETALETARTLIQKIKGLETAGGAEYQQPRLEIFNRGLLEDRQTPSRLAWFVEATGFALREYIWIDAESGALLLHFSQLPEAKSRLIYTSSEGPTLPGTLLRTEGGPPTGDTDADLAYDFAGVTYDYYLANHGRDSFNGAGAPIVSSVHYCPTGVTCPYKNAAWTGTQMIYGTGFASADDAVAHELTHAVTQYSASLFYYMQSGALNESFSDIFGETVDLTDGRGNDAAAVRWKIGEDIPGGALRDMMTPTFFGDPGKMSDPQFVCTSSEPGGDQGGVHQNSGVPNHAYALMVDGGTYNGRTITGIGTTKAAKIEYRALTVYLTAGSGFLENAAALSFSCSDLTGSFGITASDCTQVNNAVAAVEMANRWNCADATQPAPLCPVGSVASAPVFFDGFEGPIVPWSSSSNTSKQWILVTDAAKAGRAAFGSDSVPTTDVRLSMTNSVTIPAGGRLNFEHLFELESTFDGGVIEYSTNAGATWIDAGPFIDGGQTYNRTISTVSGNPLGGRPAFSAISRGYTSTRLNLAALAGQSVRFRFRLGTDESFDTFGWAVDNVRIYSCSAPTPPPPPPTNLSAVLGGPTKINLSWTASAGATSYRVKRGLTAGSETLLASGITGTTFADTTVVKGTKYYYVVTAVNAGGESANSNEVTLSVPKGSGGGDFDSDGKADVAFFRPSTGTWYILNSATPTFATIPWGGPDDIPAQGDYDGDGKSDVAFFRPSTGTWWILYSATSSFAAIPWGGPGDVPSPADFDGDGKTDLAFFRPSTGTWYILYSATPTFATIAWGGPGDVPSAGDFDGDGKADLAFFRPSTGTWYILYSATPTFSAIPWGGPGDVSTPADFDGDGKADLAFFRPSTGTWYILYSATPTFATIAWGGPGDVPTPGDFDGDGKADIVFFRPSTGTWYILYSATGTFAITPWGGPGDIPALERP